MSTIMTVTRLLWLMYSFALTFDVFHFPIILFFSNGHVNNMYLMTLNVDIWYSWFELFCFAKLCLTGLDLAKQVICC